MSHSRETTKKGWSFSERARGGVHTGYEVSRATEFLVFEVAQV